MTIVIIIILVVAIYFYFKKDKKEYPYGFVPFVHYDAKTVTYPFENTFTGLAILSITGNQIDISSIELIGKAVFFKDKRFTITDVQRINSEEDIIEVCIAEGKFLCSVELFKTIKTPLRAKEVDYSTASRNLLATMSIYENSLDVNQIGLLVGHAIYCDGYEFKIVGLKSIILASDEVYLWVKIDI